MTNKITFIFQFDHIIDIITNSSSELFVIENKCAKDTLLEMLNSALSGITKVTDYDIEERFFKDGSYYDQESKIDFSLEIFEDKDREEIKNKYFSSPKYYGISFDRDWIYTLNNDKGIDLRSKLTSIGFELIDTDY